MLLVKNSSSKFKQETLKLNSRKSSDRNDSEILDLKKLITSVAGDL